MKSKWKWIATGLFGIGLLAQLLTAPSARLIVPRHFDTPPPAAFFRPYLTSNATTPTETHGQVVVDGALEPAEEQQTIIARIQALRASRASLRAIQAQVGARIGKDAIARICAERP